MHNQDIIGGEMADEFDGQESADMMEKQLFGESPSTDSCGAGKKRHKGKTAGKKKQNAKDKRGKYNKSKARDVMLIGRTLRLRDNAKTN